MKKLFKVDTDKEAFELVSKHLLTQGVKCGNDYSCYYDGDQAIDFTGGSELNGLKCAVGALMTKEALRELGDFEGDVIELINEACAQGFETGNLDHLMLDELQRVHDSQTPDRWKVCLEKIEIMYLK